MKKILFFAHFVLTPKSFFFDNAFFVDCVTTLQYMDKVCQYQEGKCENCRRLFLFKVTTPTLCNLSKNNPFNWQTFSLYQRQYICSSGYFLELKTFC